MHALRHLETDWDSYGAAPPTEQSLQRVLDLLNQLASSLGMEFDAPFIAAAPNGSIQLEWECQRKRLEIEVPTDDSAYSYVQVTKSFNPITMKRQPDHYSYDAGVKVSVAGVLELLRWFRT